VVSASLVLAPTTGLNLTDGAGCRERALQNGAMAAEVRAPPEEEWEEAPGQAFHAEAWYFCGPGRGETLHRRGG